MHLGELIKTAEAEGREKHVPVIEVADCPEPGCSAKVIKVTVGKEVPHPNTVEHHIKWIMLLGVKDGVAVHIATFDLGPTYGTPEVTAHVNVQGISELIAVEYCNIHGLWESSHPL